MGPAHLNSAVTIGFAISGGLPWGSVLPYIAAQMLGAILGAVFVWIQFKDHYDITEDQRAAFATAPEIYNPVSNMISEAIGTFVLMFGIMSFSNYDTFPWADNLVVGVLIIGIGLSLGGTTGYAINPARDLGPRIAHANTTTSKQRPLSLEIYSNTNRRTNRWSYVAVLIYGLI